jgi:Holliday junction resolvasome RuvABC ATP-dependent DNA helicase subunit
MSVDAITSILSLPSKQEVVMEIEPYFKKMGWVDTQSKGRKLTKQGQDFVSQLQNTFEVV